MSAPLRFDLQRFLEDMIVRFNPDCIEAMEGVIAPLYKSLQDRYGDDCIEVLHHLNLAREALNELDSSLRTPDPVDEAYSDFRARQECDR